MVDRHGTGVHAERPRARADRRCARHRSDPETVTDLRQAWPPPSTPRPIVVIGAGAIVRTAHLPAYRRLGLPVAGIFDIRADAAQNTARAFDVPVVFRNLDEAAARADAVFDLAVPGDRIEHVISRLPEGAPVLIQKPMGENLDAARRILATCRDRRLTAAINFQLRFSPNMIALRQLLDERRLGELTDIEVRVVDRQPWEQWSFPRRDPIARRRAARRVLPRGRTPGARIVS